MYIKEFAGTTCIIRSISHAVALDYIFCLFAEAQKDFPELMPSNVEIRHYRENGTFGIEFSMAGCVIPNHYKEIPRSHATF